jgi:hypothetical protein
MSSPIRLTLEVEVGTLSRLLTQVARTLLTPVVTHTGVSDGAGKLARVSTPSTGVDASDSDDDESVPRIDNVADPPLVTSLDPRYYVGSLCPKGHQYQGLNLSLRYTSGHHACVACTKLYDATRPKHSRSRRRGQRHAKAHAQAVTAASNGHHPGAVTSLSLARLAPTSGGFLPVETLNGTRPELPQHLVSTTFLSPIPCVVPAHYYRDSQYVLRYIDSEQCVRCCATARHEEGD